MFVSNHTREPASATPPALSGTTTAIRYHAKVNPTDRLSLMLRQISQPESSWSASRADVARSWAVSPSFGSPGTSPPATRHSPLTSCRSSALFRSSAILGMTPPVGSACQSGRVRSTSAGAGRMTGGGPAQVLGEEAQRARPGIVVGVGVVPGAAPVHEGVVGSRIRVELVDLSVPGQLGVELAHVRRRRVGVLLAEEADQRAMDVR